MLQWIQVTFKLANGISVEALLFKSSLLTSYLFKISCGYTSEVTVNTEATTSGAAAKWLLVFVSFLYLSIAKTIFRYYLHMVNLKLLIIDCWPHLNSSTAAGKCCHHFPFRLCHLIIWSIYKHTRPMLKSICTICQSASLIFSIPLLSSWITFFSLTICTACLSASSILAIWASDRPYGDLFLHTLSNPFTNCEQLRYLIRSLRN